MISDIITLFDEVLKGNHNIWIILSVFLSIWLFREIRSHATKSTDMEPARIDKTLEVYGAIEYIIESSEYDLDEVEQKLKKLISSNYTYLSRQFYLQWERYKKNKTDEERSILIKMLKEEIGGLQYNISSRIDIFNNIGVSSYFRIIKSVGVALLVTGVCIFIIICYLVLLMYLTDSTVLLQSKLILGFRLTSAVLFLTFLATWLEFSIETRIKYTFNNIILLLLMIAVFTFVFIYSYSSIVFILFGVYFFSKLYPPMIKTPHEVYLEKVRKEQVKISD